LGTEGRLVITRPFTGQNDPESEMVYVTADGEAGVVAVPEKELYAGEIEDMHVAILDGQPNYLTLEETRNHIRTLLALYESARRGQRVWLDEIS
jgi:predicted dehydrogenase